MPLVKRYSKKNLKDQFKKKKTASTIGYIPANATMQVRLLQEPDQWAQVFCHYVDKKFIWCTQDETGDCIGCERSEKKKELWILNVLDRKAGAVVLLQIPFSLAQQLFRRYEKYGTVMDRDFELIREGAGLETEYSHDPLDKSRFNADRYANSMLDAEAAVAAEVEENSKKPRSTKKRSSRDDDDDDFEDDDEDEEFEDEDEDEDEDDEEEEEDERPARRPARRSYRPSSRRTSHEDEDDEDEEEDDDEDEEDARPARRPAVKSKPSRKSRDGLDEFRPEKSRHPAAKTSPSRVVRRTR